MHSLCTHSLNLSVHTLIVGCSISSMLEMLQFKDPHTVSELGHGPERSWPISNIWQMCGLMTHSALNRAGTFLKQSAGLLCTSQALSKLPAAFAEWLHSQYVTLEQALVLSQQLLEWLSWLGCCCIHHTLHLFLQHTAEAETQGQGTHLSRFSDTSDLADSDEAPSSQSD